MSLRSCLGKFWSDRMTAKKRRTLDDDAAAFVFGGAGDEPPKTPPTPSTKTTPKTTPKTSTPQTTAKDRLMQAKPAKEASTRITIDLPQSLHKKLSIFCAQQGATKAEVVRELLKDLLAE
ncbi:MAG: hypothetical protein HC771_22375 [Synechococcales cyanobacterium CRU_2_2]|nr:hypothetical protein [Synechococcales cyanobacterium CRU_2_2]